MEFWRTILVLLCRKSVLLPVLLFSLGVAAATYVVIPTDYVSSATAVLTTSTDGGVVNLDPARPPEKINPLHNFDGMKTAASILIQIMNTREVENQLDLARGGATSYVVTDGSTIPQLLGTNGPFIVIEGHSTVSHRAYDIVVRVEQRIRDELIKQQRALNAPPSTFIGMIDVIPPSPPEAQHGAKQKGAAGALVLGFIASLSVAYLRHRPRRADLTETPSPDTVSAQRNEAGRAPAESEPSEARASLKN